MLVRSRISLVLLTVLSACILDTGTEPDSETGSVTVTAVTTGTDLDTEYGVTIGSLSGTLPANGSVTIADVPVGGATVELTGVAANCAVRFSTSQSVTVAASTAVPAEFAVVCEATLDVPATIAEAIESMEEAMFAGLNIDAVSGLDDFSFEESNGLFLAALSAAPTNETALFGAAVTGIFLLEDNADVRSLVDDWDEWLDDGPNPSPVATLLGPAMTAIRDRMTMPLGFSTGTIEQVTHSGMAAFELAGGPALTHGAPPSVEELQTVLRDVVRPALTEALEHLFEITNVSFRFTVTPAMQGELPIDADALELDYTEILTMQAGLQAALAAVDIATAYLLTPNPLGAQGFVDAMTPGSTFLTLAPGGAEALGDALERLQSAGTILLTAFDALEAETDDQTDDIIKLDPNCCDDFTFRSAQELADAKALVQDLRDALSSPTVVTVEPGTEDEISFMLDARQFFVNPIADLKAMLAPYEVFTADEAGETVEVFRWLALNLDEWTLPDPSFNGILPEISTMSDLFNTFPEFGEVFFDASLTEGYYRLTTVTNASGEVFDCEAIVQASFGLEGCRWTSTSFIFFSDISLGGFDDEPFASVFFSFSFGFFAFSGSYVVVDNLDDTYTVTMDLLNEDDGSPLTITRTFRDNPGFASIDEFGRSRGGSSLSFLTGSGRVFLYERQ